MRKNHEDASIHRSQGKHRALSALTSLSFAAAIGCATIGCSGGGISEAESNHADEEASSNDAAENALLESHLQARGYDTSTLQVQGDTVIVEDDVVMSRAMLLGEAEADAAGVVEKGYFLGTRLFSGKRIQLSIAADVSDTWRDAFDVALNEWNNRTPMFARDPGSAATISVVLGTLGASTFANGTFPPGRTITLNSNYSGTCATSLENLPADVKTYTALHEIGHVLGFDHPPPDPASGSGRVHISGTAESTELIEPSYATVMAQGCETRTALTGDDVLSARIKYPSCIETCEFNCTFNVDPAQIGLCMSACPSQCGG